MFPCNPLFGLQHLSLDLCCNECETSKLVVVVVVVVVVVAVVVVAAAVVVIVAVVVVVVVVVGVVVVVVVGLVYCKNCGSHAGTGHKILKLVARCVAPGRWGKGVLDDIQNDKVPRGLSQWPYQSGVTRQT